MFARGRESADVIATQALSRAGAAARQAAAGGTGDRERLLAVARAAEYLSSGDPGAARRLGVAGVLVLRHAASSLRAERGDAAGLGGAREPYAEAIRIHHETDAAATALGASPDCFDDADDWSLPDDGDRVVMTHLASTARTGTLLAQGLDDMTARFPRHAVLIRRDAECIVAGSLVLQVACLEPEGIPRPLGTLVARTVAVCVDRICASAVSWRALDPGGPVGRIGEVLEASGRFAGEVLSELDAPAPAPGY